ncbi:hypothetical protein CMTB2_01064 [Caminibacter mediatlanticus TB-2]|uniref:Uncharacterized protein n=1 Tax=Caminibacter mediatlanticus TB-2 TaxID=391592 RepID=A0AAI9AHY2_9BACT|nr:hypothetical protein CMTB2_01064 [Caminibacter mediatlanticus TB-2]
MLNKGKKIISQKKIKNSKTTLKAKLEENNFLDIFVKIVFYFLNTIKKEKNCKKNI